MSKPKDPRESVVTREDVEIMRRRARAAANASRGQRLSGTQMGEGPSEPIGSRMGD